MPRALELSAVAARVGLVLPMPRALSWCQRSRPFPRDLAAAFTTGLLLAGAGTALLVGPHWDGQASQEFGAPVLRLPKWLLASRGVLSALVTRWQVLNK